MDFYASKLLWFLLQPSSLIAGSLTFGALLVWRNRMLWGKRLLALGVAGYLAAGFSPLGNWLFLPLEERVARAALDGETVSGIIVLGGALDTVIGLSRGGPPLNEAAERMTETVALARAWPGIPVIFSGGVGEILSSEVTEADIARRLFTDLGLAPERLIFEGQSRNTFENAAYTAELVRGLEGDGFLLVTSAYHMPRAKMLLEAQGLAVFPWPVDYRTRGASDVWRFFPRASEGLRRVDIASREWAGLAMAWLRGQTPALLP
jgi:uncharacterized SAM-binding protein YcdF (DUF218 family)